MKDSGKIVLAIESAIFGGSISLQNNGVETANWIGSSNVSKAEDLLANIDEILTANSVSRNDIGLVAVSAGPGSFTGIRIGIATALGLKAGLGVKMSSVSALLAVASQFDQPGKYSVIVPMGRNSVCVQSFQIDETGCKPFNEPHTLSDEGLAEFVNGDENSKMALHSSLFDRFSALPNTENIGSNIAYPVGKLGASSPGIVVEPLFVSKSF